MVSDGHGTHLRPWNREGRERVGAAVPRIRDQPPGNASNTDGSARGGSAPRRLDPALTTEYRPYHAHDLIEPLLPNEAYAVDVKIWPASIVLPPGYRVALSVSGRDYDYGDTAQAAAKLMVRLTTKQPKRGPGAFMHDDPRHRPPEIFGGTMTPHRRCLRQLRAAACGPAPLIVGPASLPISPTPQRLWRLLQGWPPRASPVAS